MGVVEVVANNFTPEGTLKYEPIAGVSSNIESDLKNKIGFLSNLTDGDGSDGSNF